MQEELDTIAAVSRAVQRLVRKGRSAEYSLANGIVLKIKPVPPHLLTAVAREFPDPEPPVVFMEEKGRDEPNPFHPDYVKILADNEYKKNLAVNDVVLGVGTEFVSAPDGMYGPQEDGWLKGLDLVAQLSGKELQFDRDNEIARYIAWLRFYALESSTDIAIATALTYQLTGIAEGEVEEILEAFQGNEGRRADSPADAPPVNSNGNKPNRASRRASPRNRGT